MPEPGRIVVFGMESTGKTSLARRLAAHLGEPCAPEYVRQFWEERGGNITAADLDAIARGQVAGEDAAAAAARRWVICDTDLLTCTLWDDLLFPGACPAWVREEAERRVRRTALFLLCEADVPFAPDPQRCFPAVEDRTRVARLWSEALAARGANYVSIRGDWRERERTALAAVAALGAEPAS